MSGESFARAVAATPHSTAAWLETLASLILAGYSRESLELLASARTTETTPDYKDLGEQMANENFEYTVKDGTSYRLIVTGGDEVVDRRDVGHPSWHRNAYKAEGLREFFQAERDHKLGRARWPENPDYVIYRDESEDDKDGRYVRVVNESKGTSIAFWEKLTFRSSQNYDRAARWYFTEGPGKPERPWEDAQPGEVWRLTIDGEEGNYLVKAGGEGPQYLSGQRDCFVVDHTRITAGRKVLNADGSVADE